MMGDSYEGKSAASDPLGDVAAEAGEKDERELQNPPDQLQAELESLREESERLRDRYLRKAAELENYRKRVDREKRESVLHAKSQLLQEFLPIMDACERASGSFDDAQSLSEGLEQYKQGVELLYRQLGSALSRLGVKPIEAVGKPFDPHLHEALTRMETSEYEENTVITELRRGYMFHDRLLRPAQVVVSARPDSQNGGPQ